MKIQILFMFCCFHQGLSATDPWLQALIHVISGIEQVIAVSFVSNCSKIQQAFGITYEQMIKYNTTPDMLKMSVELHTPSNIHYFNFTTAGKDVLASPYFNKSLPIALYVHGYLSDTTNPGVKGITKGLLYKGGRNVLVLDASRIVMTFYIYCATAGRFIGESLGKVLADFFTGGVKAKDIYLIGHSLGAHISGYAGQVFFNTTGTKIGRISGLDPSGPCFFQNSENYSLSKDDAQFVDVIHTDAGVFGISKQVGHIDFYPNGGSAQPEAIVPTEGHIRGWKYFNESLYGGTSFIAVQCSNYTAFSKGFCANNFRAVMGIYADISGIGGTYYLNTAGTPPYSLGDVGIVKAPNAFTDFFIWLATIFKINP